MMTCRNVPTKLLYKRDLFLLTSSRAVRIEALYLKKTSLFVDKSYYSILAERAQL